MKEHQSIIEIPLAALLDNVQRMHASGWRLVQICCTRLSADHEVNYSFDRGPMATGDGPAFTPAPAAAAQAPAGDAPAGHAAQDPAEPAAAQAPAPQEAAVPALPTDAAGSEAAPRFVTLRVRLPLENPELPSVSSFYWSAFLYENEMHDLFGVIVKGMAVDFHGKLYTTAVPAPYTRKDV